MNFIILFWWQPADMDTSSEDCTPVAPIADFFKSLFMLRYMMRHFGQGPITSEKLNMFFVCKERLVL